MILNRKQIEQLARMAGYEVKDISGSEPEEEFQLFKGSLVDPENGEFIEGIIACSYEYPDEIMDILEP
ncbi:hypothetical protein XbC2_495 [Xanthomonas phage XbC2]|nr:hypothetical protein XbC2_495 [Xanthomonas phage XbC2]